MVGLPILAGVDVLAAIGSDLAVMGLSSIGCASRD